MKPNRIPEKLLLFFAALALLVACIGCKSRKVALDKTTQNENTQYTYSDRDTRRRDDTSSLHGTFTSRTDDTTASTVEITNDAGTVQTFTIDQGGKFSYTGNARAIRFTGASRHQADAQTTLSARKGISETQDHQQSGQFKQQKKKTEKKKDVESTINWGATIELICCIVLGLVIVYLVVKRFNILTWLKKLYDKFR